MLTSAQTNLKPLIESKDGIHFTAYLVNRGDLIDLKFQLHTAIVEADEWLNPVLSIEERNKFLEPLAALLNDARFFTHLKGNIGIFRNEDFFRVLNIPIDVEQSCQVATSFHVKPLLRWLQSDQDFLLIGIEKESADLYLGSQSSFKLIDSKAQQDMEREAGTFAWLNGWIAELTKNAKPKLFFAGEPELVKLLQQNLKYEKVLKNPVSDSFNRHKISGIFQNIRARLKEESKKNIERALLEFRFAEQANRAKKNIFQIAKAVVRGKVRKLIVTDELNIFGKIDPQSGGLAIHPCDLDHEDDCILDDLAQMVLSKGGEVVIAKRNEIPKGRPILAILDDGEDLVKTEDLQFENLPKEL